MEDTPIYAKVEAKVEAKTPGQFAEQMRDQMARIDEEINANVERRTAINGEIKELRERRSDLERMLRASKRKRRTKKEN